MKQVLAADIGGTKTLLQLVEIDLTYQYYKIIQQKKYSSKDYASFEIIVDDFISICRNKIKKLNSLNACFAIAGPIQTMHQNTQQASVTNLDWQINSAETCQRHGLANVRLINDFEAIAHGLRLLDNNDRVVIHQGDYQPNSPKLILGAGTGLGVCQIIYHNDSYRVIASEGGHSDFAPANPQQIRLLEFLAKKYAHLSYDRLLSGLGISNIFSFLVNEYQKENDAFVYEVKNALDPAEKISGSTDEQPLAKETIDIFMSIYGAQAGNFALTNLPYGGVHIAGGIAPKLINELKASDFLKSFKAKGRMSELMEKFPVSVIMDTEVGVKGAAVVAC